MYVSISGKELRRAMKDVERAEKNGFKYCQAVLEAKKMDSMGWIEMGYSDLWERAHPTDGRYDWGRGQDVAKYHKFQDGKLVNLKKKSGN